MNREQRYDLAHRALESCIEENADGVVILVEGRRDEIALRSLGSVSYTHLTLPTKA